METMPPNMKRMLELIEDVFQMRNDPDQMDFSEEMIAELMQLHPACMDEWANEDGPCIWTAIVPTTHDVMQQFVSGKITEKEVLSMTKPGDCFDSIYLCSVIALPEYRGQGKTYDMCMKSIRAIMQDHPIASLFVWPFTHEGMRLSVKISQTLELPLHVRAEH